MLVVLIAAACFTAVWALVLLAGAKRADQDAAGAHQGRCVCDEQPAHLEDRP